MTGSRLRKEVKHSGLLHYYSIANQHSFHSDMLKQKNLSIACLNMMVKDFIPVQNNHYSFLILETMHILILIIWL